MIAQHLIQEINDLSVRLTGDDITPEEEQTLNESSIEELEAMRDGLVMALEF